MQSKIHASFACVLALSLLGSMPVAAQTKWQDSPEVKKLYEAAKKEGQVTLWGNQINIVNWVPAAFAKQFPGIEVRFLADTEIGVKAIAEFRAGRNEVDVFMSSATIMQPLLERNMFAKIDWTPFGTVDDNVAFGGRGGMTHSLAYSVIYNKKLVKPEDVPNAWVDVLQPKYKNKIVGNAFLVPRVIAALGLAWGEDKTLQFARDVMQTGILVTRSPSDGFLQSGERPYAISFDSHAKFLAAQGLPVDFVIPEPMATVQFVAAVMEKSPRPNAARLLAGYLTTPEAKREAAAASFFGDYRRNSTDPVARKIWGSGGTVLSDDRLEDLPVRDAMTRKVNPIIAGQVR